MTHLPPPQLPPIREDDIPELLDQWARALKAYKGEGFGFSSKSALAGFADPPTTQRPGARIPTEALEGYGTTERRLIVATGYAVSKLPPRAQVQIALRYLANPRLSRAKEQKFFKVSCKTLCQWWRGIQRNLATGISQIAKKV